MNSNNQLNSLLSRVEDVEKVKGDVARSNALMIGVLVVLFIGFIGVEVALVGLFLDAYRSKEASYQDLVNKIATLRQCNLPQQ